MVGVISIMEKLNLIYIAPMGYSGSTLLDLLLNQHRQIQSVGEVMFFDEWIEKDLLCSCNKNISKCSFWDHVRKPLPSGFKLYGMNGKFETFSGFLSGDIEKYANRTYQLLKSVQEYSNVEYVLDSSKNIARLEKLAASSLINLKVIHLVRNGKDVVNSGFKEKKMPSFEDSIKTNAQPAYKMTLRWLLVNSRIEKICEKRNITHDILRYEDLISNPQKEMSRLFRFLDLPTMKINKHIDNENIHNISGSRWRYNKNLKIQNNYSKENSLETKDNLIFEIIAGFKYRKYGYTK